MVHVRQPSLPHSNISTGASPHSSTPESLGSASTSSSHHRTPSSSSKIFIVPPPPPPLQRRTDSSSVNSPSPAITTPSSPYSPSNTSHPPSATHSRSPSTSSPVYANALPPHHPPHWTSNSPQPNATHVRNDSLSNPSHPFHNPSYLNPGSFSPSQSSMDRMAALSYSPPSVHHHQRQGTSPDMTSIHSSPGIGSNLLVPLPSSRQLANSAPLHHHHYHHHHQSSLSQFNPQSLSHYDTGVDKQAYQLGPSTLPTMDPNLSARYKSPPPLPHETITQATQSQNPRQHQRQASSNLASWPPPPPPLLLPITNTNTTTASTSTPLVRTPSPLDYGPFPSSSVPPAHLAANTAPPRPPKPPELVFGNSGREGGSYSGATSRTIDSSNSQTGLDGEAVSPFQKIWGLTLCLI
jgi:hypothetical protein